MRVGWQRSQGAFCGSGTAPCGVEERIPIQESYKCSETPVLGDLWCLSIPACQQRALDVQREY